MNGFSGASLGFPVAWEKESKAPLSPASELPSTAEEIGSYLRNGHFHLCLSEAPLGFSFAGVMKVRDIGERRYWAVQARDDMDRVWAVFVGSGTSCFRTDRYMRRWMTGMLPDGSLSPDQMLQAEIVDQLDHDRSYRRKSETGGSN